ncbi:hypothetical protein B7463_g9163, partial [Scytalidium lignicola]
MVSEGDHARLFTFETGDVEILVTYENTPVVGKVASQAMALGSPVWKKFMFPPWRSLPEANSVIDSEYLNGEDTGNHKAKQVDFTEDDGEALLLLLNIVHLKYKLIPTTLSYDQLLLVDQYDCYDLVEPWVDRWLPDEKIESQNPEEKNWLFIAWAFDRKKIIEDLALDMVCRIKLGDEMTPLWRSGQPVQSPFPSDILENILIFFQKESFTLAVQVSGNYSIYPTEKLPGTRAQQKQLRPMASEIP